MGYFRPGRLKSGADLVMGVCDLVRCGPITLVQSIVLYNMTPIWYYWVSPIWSDLLRFGPIWYLEWPHSVLWRKSWKGRLSSLAKDPDLIHMFIINKLLIIFIFNDCFNCAKRHSQNTRRPCQNFLPGVLCVTQGHRITYRYVPQGRLWVESSSIDSGPVALYLLQWPLGAAVSAMRLMLLRLMSGKQKRMKWIQCDHCLVSK